jgi:phage recombination protein Bet
MAHNKPPPHEASSHTAIVPAAPATRVSLIARVANRYYVDPAKMLETLKLTAFKIPGKDDVQVTNEQMMALLVVADQYQLNPFTRELFAFPQGQATIVPMISVDGWSRIINQHPQCDGVDFELHNDPVAITCTIYRRDRSHPTRVTEYLAECKRNTGPWNSHPMRMLRHKALIQCARLAFGLGGIYDEDEGRRIIDATEVAPPPPPPTARIGDGGTGTTERLRAAVKAAREPEPPPSPLVVEPPAPAAQPPAKAAESESPVATLGELVGRIDAAENVEQAREVLNMAKAILSDEQFADLQQAYRIAWTDPNTGELPL